MSFDLIWNAPESSFRSSTHLLVALVVCRYSRTDGICYAYKRTLAKRARLHEKTIQRILGELAEDKIIKISETIGVDGRNGANRIWFTMSGTINSEGDSSEVEPHGAEQDPGSPFRSRPRRAKATDSSSSGAQDSSYIDNRNLNETLNEESNGGAIAPDPVLIAFEEWNETARNLGLPIAEKLTDQRRKKLKKRLTENDGAITWRRALAGVEQSKFLRGLAHAKDGEAPFRCTLDFLLQPSSFQKVIEGAYGRDAPAADETAIPVEDRFAEKLRTDRRFAMSLCDRWRQDRSQWPAEAGPEPHQDGCHVPEDIQAMFPPMPPMPSPARATDNATPPAPADEDEEVLS